MLQVPARDFQKRHDDGGQREDGHRRPRQPWQPDAHGCERGRHAHEEHGRLLDRVHEEGKVIGVSQDRLTRAQLGDRESQAKQRRGAPYFAADDTNDKRERDVERDLARDRPASWDHRKRRAALPRAAENGCDGDVRRCDAVRSPHSWPDAECQRVDETGDPVTGSDPGNPAQRIAAEPVAVVNRPDRQRKRADNEKQDDAMLGGACDGVAPGRCPGSGDMQQKDQEDGDPPQAVQRGHMLRQVHPGAIMVLSGRATHDRRKTRGKARSHARRGSGARAHAIRA